MPPGYESSSTGLRVNAAGEVVAAEPIEGRRLDAPGGPLTPDVLAANDAAGG
jgi:hypothetical protein